jgi:hypothetical protein
VENSISDKDREAGGCWPWRGDARTGDTTGRGRGIATIATSAGFSATAAWVGQDARVQQATLPINHNGVTQGRFPALESVAVVCMRGRLLDAC